MGMHNYGFLLDENVVKLKSLFPRNRAKTVHDYSLDGKEDAKVIKTAGDEGLIIVTADAQYPEFFRTVAKTGRSGRHSRPLRLSSTAIGALAVPERDGVGSDRPDHPLIAIFERSEYRIRSQRCSAGEHTARSHDRISHSSPMS